MNISHNSYSCVCFSTCRLLPILLLAQAWLASAATLYVNVNSASPAFPYNNWELAATNIQDAIDAADTGDLILVTNGVYETGGRVVYGALTNRVAVIKSVTVQSVNGPAVTAIRGYQVPGVANDDSAVRCVYLTNGSVLSGFTLSNGATRSTGDEPTEQAGGGVWCESTDATIVNCNVTGNSASYGGGAYSGVFNNCTISGNWAIISGGGTYGAILSGCMLASNMAFSSGGGAYGGNLSNSTLLQNSTTEFGGGAYSCTLTNCLLINNSAYWGGGACFSSLYSCSLTNNSALETGGGAYASGLTHCTVTGNASFYGGGADNSTLYNCDVNSNSATYGGGVGSFLGASAVNNCTLNGNRAYFAGGGAHGAKLNNCTLTGNSAKYYGGGIYGGNLTNCIVYYNRAAEGENYYNSTLTYCCASPLPAAGTGNLDTDPQLASASHLSPQSPCRARGGGAYITGYDIDGQSWLNPPSIGCDEYYSGSVTGALSLAILTTYTNVIAGFSVDFRANIAGRANASRWEFDDGTVISNRPLSCHSWTTIGEHMVVLRVYNESYPTGVTATTTVHVVKQPIHYVNLGSVSPTIPYTNWATGATNIQDAVDAASVAGAMVLVSNGVYEIGGRVVYGNRTNRVVIAKPVTVQSVNGPDMTTIRGYLQPDMIYGDLSIRCVYLADGATLSGFTLVEGGVGQNGNWEEEQCGGGVRCESTNATVTNCVIIGSTAFAGGGAFSGTLYTCTLTNNYAGHGAGVYKSTLYNCKISSNTGGPAIYGGAANNCTVVDNIARYGGGAFASILKNCIVYSNYVGHYITVHFNYAECHFANSCTFPMPANGINNITDDPLFMDYEKGNLRLQSNSPCINAGNNVYVIGRIDLDGRPRFIGRTVDIGAYEFRGEFDSWLAQFGLHISGADDYTDTDHDGLNNWQEFVAGTAPTNTTSTLRLQTPVVAPAGVLLRWSSITNRTYFVERATALGPPARFSVLQTNIIGMTTSTGLTDTNPPPFGPAFYRIGVQP